MTYEIHIEYITGDSFGSYNEKSKIELSWQNLDVAKENLQRIKSHYLYYQELNSTLKYSKKEIKDLVERHKNCPWFVKDKHNSEYNLYLKLDDGTEHKYSANEWVGYFERLLSAEIIADNSDMKVEFY